MLCLDLPRGEKPSEAAGGPQRAAGADVEGQEGAPRQVARRGGWGQGGLRESCLTCRLDVGWLVFSFYPEF